MDRKMLQPPCRRIEPDGYAGGYLCLNCGRNLTPTPNGWWRHGPLQIELPNRR